MSDKPFHNADPTLMHVERAPDQRQPIATMPDRPQATEYTYAQPVVGVVVPDAVPHAPVLYGSDAKWAMLDTPTVTRRREVPHTHAAGGGPPLDHAITVIDEVLDAIVIGLPEDAAKRIAEALRAAGLL